MSNDTSRATGWIVAVILGIILFFAWDGNSSNEEELSAAHEEISSLESRIEDYQSALSEANSTIEELNSDIEFAQSYSGSSYEEMVDALDNLQTRETVSEP